MSLFLISEGIFEIKATANNTYLSSKDFDNRLVNHFVNKFKRKYNKDLTTNAYALRRLRTTYEHLFRGTIEPVKRILRNAKINKASVYEIVLVSGSTYIPKIQKLVSDLFNKDTNKSINPNKAVFKGKRARTKDNNLFNKFELTDIPPPPTIKVTYDLDTNGIMNISAVEKGIRKTYKITISNNKGRLSKEEIEYILSKAKKYKEEDKAEANRI
ncbi:uncharacterized protein N7477_004212 [Penicillium maclennaniae]|uniref:uncharacterized protein n=1 Tax=Penicillium maclennaniae TaxID=1343394 RepID=UPI002540F9FC|nr:uncharacterized protein N7477_004212 [Penicillium maclennaniae]KAJ5674278.1 hypothetical protein N7477_004212 [Penicillium maclennaniae]